MRKLATVAACAAAFLVGMNLPVPPAPEMEQPAQCAWSEDSCQPTYTDGRWAIVPVTP